MLPSNRQQATVLIVRAFWFLSRVGSCRGEVSEEAGERFRLEWNADSQSEVRVINDGIIIKVMTLGSPDGYGAIETL